MKKLIIASVLLAVPVLAQDSGENFPPPPHLQGKMGGFRNKVQALGLTDEQKRKLRELRKKSTVSEKRKTWMSEKKLLNEMIRNKSTEKPTIQKQLDTLNKVQAELNKERVEKLIEIRNILTDEQREKLQSMREERMNNKGPGGGGFMMNRRGEGSNGFGRKGGGGMRGGPGRGQKGGYVQNQERGLEPSSGRQHQEMQSEGEIQEEDLEF